VSAGASQSDNAVAVPHDVVSLYVHVARCAGGDGGGGESHTMSSRCKFTWLTVLVVLAARLAASKPYSGTHGVCVTSCSAIYSDPAKFQVRTERKRAENR